MAGMRDWQRPRRALLRKTRLAPRGTVVNTLETTSGTFLLDVWRYEKKLPAHA